MRIGRMVVIAGVFLTAATLSRHAAGEQLVVRLRSGTFVTVEYTGTVHGVTVGGGTDELAGFETEGRKSTVAGMEGAREKEAAAPAAADGSTEKKTRWLGLKWAKPRSED